MQEEECGDLDIDPAEREVVALFLRLENRWQIIAGFSGAMYTGCDIGFAIKMLELRGATGIDKTIDELLLMEAAAKEKLNSILNRRAAEREQAAKRNGRRT